MSETPPQARARIKSLDVIRGFALLGILAVNAIYFAAPWQAGVNPALAPLSAAGASFWPWFVMHVFFEYKCITLFSMLFGASLYLVGGERDEEERGAQLRRRLFWLAVFGLIHGLVLWYGDVLLLYALTGVFVMLARSWRAHALMFTGIVLFALAQIFTSSFALVYDHIPADQIARIKHQIWAPPLTEIAATIAAYRAGVVQALPLNVATWRDFIVGGLPVLIVRTAGMMMIGMALFKWRMLSGGSRARVYWLIAALGAIALALIAWQAWLNAEAHFSFEHMQRRGALANAVLSPFVSLLYASALILLLKSGALRFATDALAAVGRMALSNYIAQTLIMTTLFWGGWRGFGLYGALDRTQLWAIVVTIWLAQLIWSPLWLRVFHMGPLEWVWRRLTYKRPVMFAK